MLKLDSHVHFWQLARGDYSWMTPDMHAIQRDFGRREFEHVKAGNNVGQIILVQAAPTIAETRYIIDLADDCDYVTGVIGKVDIEVGRQAIKQLDELVADPLFLGVRPMLEDMDRNRWLDLEGLDECIRHIIALGLSFECMVMPAELEALLAWLGKYPQLRAVLSHGGMPDIAAGEFVYWAEQIKHLAAETGIYCKLSGLLTQAGGKRDVESLRPYIEHLISCFGPERLIWGSDWPVLLCAGDYADWCSICDEVLAALEVEQREAIFVGNARRFYRLAADA